MAQFTYQALSSAGRPQSGTLAAADRGAALRALEARGLAPTRVQEAQSAGGSRVPAAQTLAFVRSLEGLLAAGVPLSRALTVIERGCRHPAAGAAWGRIHAQVRDGRALADAMADEAGLFPPVFLAMVRAGEAGGFLSVVLGQIADYWERQRELSGRVMTAMAYPIVLGVVASGVVIFLLTWFIPRFSDLFASFGAELPLLTRCIQGASHMLLHHGWLAALLAAAVVIGVRFWRRSEVGALAWERFILRLPAVGEAVAALARVRFCRMLGTLLKSGVPLLGALAVAREATGSRTLAAQIEAAGEQLRQGGSLSAALAGTGRLLTPEHLEALAMAEAGSRLPDELLRLAAQSDRELDRRLRTAVALAEPLLLLVMASLVGTIVVGMLLPVFDLWSAIQ